MSFYFLRNFSYIRECRMVSGRIVAQIELQYEVSFRKIMKVILAASAELKKEGIQCKGIELRTVLPIHYTTIINCAQKINRLLIVEEAWPLASIATDITFVVQNIANKI